MNLNDEEGFEVKMEEIVVSLEMLILDVISTAVKRLMENNLAFLQDAQTATWKTTDNDLITIYSGVSTGASQFIYSDDLKIGPI